MLTYFGVDAQGVDGDQGKGEGRHVLTTWHSQYVISFVMLTGFPFVASSVTATTESSFVTSSVILTIDFDCVNSCWGIAEVSLHKQNSETALKASSTFSGCGRVVAFVGVSDDLRNMSCFYSWK